MYLYYGRYVYAVGGMDGTEILNSVERYDMSANVWCQVAPLPQPLRFSTALSLHGKLYVFGGETAENIVNNVYRYVWPASTFSTRLFRCFCLYSKVCL